MIKAEYMKDPKILCLIRLAEEIADSTYPTPQKIKVLNMLEKDGITFILDLEEGHDYKWYCEKADEFIVNKMLKLK